MMLRKTLENLSRNVILYKRLPKAFGGSPLFISPGAGLRYWIQGLAKVDPMLLKIVEQYIKRKQIVWDIGANVGLFSFTAANIVGEQGQVLAMEPDVWLVHLLRKSKRLKKNRHLNIDIIGVAASNEVAIAPFHIANRSRSANHLESVEGSTQTGGTREVQFVPTVTLDWILTKFAAPDFIKIDAEGAEHKILAGSTQILSDVKPLILCEVLPENCQAVTEILKTFGYKLFNADSDLDCQYPLEKAVWNTIACPQDNRVKCLP